MPEGGSRGGEPASRRGRAPGVAGFDLRYNRSRTREPNLSLRPGREGTDLKAGIYRKGRKVGGSEEGNGKTISSRHHR